MSALVGRRKLENPKDASRNYTSIHRDLLDHLVGIDHMSNVCTNYSTSTLLGNLPPSRQHELDHTDLPLNI